jgi:hypothetical protein
MKSGSPFLYALAAGLLIAAPASAQLNTYNCGQLDPQNGSALQAQQKPYAETLYTQCKNSKTITAPSYDSIVELYDLSINWYKDPGQNHDSLEKIFNETVELYDGFEAVSLANLDKYIDRIKRSSAVELTPGKSVLQLLMHKIKNLNGQNYTNFESAFFKPYLLGELRTAYSDTFQMYSKDTHNKSNKSNTNRDESNFISIFQPLLSYLHWLIMAVLGVLLATLFFSIKTLGEKVEVLSKTTDGDLGKIKSEIIRIETALKKQQTMLITLADKPRYIQVPQVAEAPPLSDTIMDQQKQPISPLPASEPWITTYLRDRLAATYQAKGLLKLMVPLENQVDRSKNQAELVLQECSGGEFYYFAYPDQEQDLYQVVPHTEKYWFDMIRSKQRLERLYHVHTIADPSRKKGQIINISEPARMRKEHTGHWTLVKAGHLELAGSQ